LPYPAILVLGPFMHGNLQSEFMDRARRLDSVAAITFDAHVERLVADAIGVVAMGGYNLFCEILSFDKPGLVVPRTVPRMEQYIRAARAQELGLVRMLPDGGNRSPEIMAAAIRELPQSPRPSSVRMPALLDGLSVINGMIDGWLTPRHRTPAKLSVVNRNE
jgi:predicted glycosyltransferase